MIDLSKEISGILDEVSFEVSKKVEKAVKKTARSGLRALKNHNSTYQIRSGRYNKAWKTKLEKLSTRNTKAIIHNTKFYHLTYMLERGHAKRGGGRTRAFRHIEPVEKEVIEMFEREVRKGIESK